MEVTVTFKQHEANTVVTALESLGLASEGHDQAFRAVSDAYTRIQTARGAEYTDLRDVVNAIEDGIERQVIDVQARINRGELVVDEDGTIRRP